jgi:hypothetical protein
MGMKKLIIMILLGLMLGAGTSLARAQQQAVPSPSPEIELDETATEAAEPATPAATPIVTREDITEPRGEVQGRLERYLLSQDIGEIGPLNFVRHAMREAVVRGVPANTLVLLLLFPMVAMIIAAARHLIGLRGFGIYIPAVLSVAFVATGMVSGILLFIVILGLGTYGMRAFKFLRLQYLPRMALLIWLVSIGVFATMLLSPLIGLPEISSINIFPILILILLAENFNEVQLGKSRREATELTIETLLLALISALVLSLDVVQRLALLYPELLILTVAVANLVIGRYVGLRLSEYMRFKKLLDS